jgi:hypothetical protein
VDGDILKRTLNEDGRKAELESSDLGRGKEGGFCEHGNELLGCIKYR